MKLRTVYLLVFFAFNFLFVSAHTHSHNGNGISYTSLAISLSSANQRADSASVGESSRKNDSILNTKKKVKRWEIGVNGGIVYPYKYGGYGEYLPIIYSLVKAFPTAFAGLNVFYRTKRPILFSAGINYSSNVFSSFDYFYGDLYNYKYYYKYINLNSLLMYELSYKKFSVLPCLGIQFTELLQGNRITQLFTQHSQATYTEVLYEKQGIKIGMLGSLTLAYKISDRIKVNLAASYSHALQPFKQGFITSQEIGFYYTVYRVYLPIYYTFSTGLIYSL